MDETRFSEDILVEILSHLPKKSLARFKCVSKKWHCLISNPRNPILPKTSHSGLFSQAVARQPLLTRNSESPQLLNFLRLHCNGTASVDRVIPIDVDKAYVLLDSCSGLLLFRKHDLCFPDFPDYVVYDPAIKRRWDVNPPEEADEPIHIGLAPSSDGRHFHLAFFCSAYDNNRFNMYIYSSEDDGCWEDIDIEFHEDLRIVNYPPQMTDSGKSVFVKGAWHWIWANYLLVYFWEDRHLELVELPRDSKRSISRENQCIWESEGCLNYCEVVEGKISIWVLHRTEQTRGWRPYPFKWNAKHQGVLAPPPSVTNSEKPISFSPFGFNDDFSIVYLNGRRKVFSYKLGNNEMIEAYGSPFLRHYRRAYYIIVTFLSIPQAEVEDRRSSDPCSDETLKRRKLI